MKVLLINVRYDERNFRYRVNKLCPPLGIAYIAGILRSSGHDVSILDMEALRMDYESLPEYLETENPDIIGVHGTTPTSRFIKETVEIARKSCPDVKIIVGGPHASLLPEDIFRDMPAVDYILRGEAEFTMRDLVGLISNCANIDDFKTIPGIGFRNGDKRFISTEMPRIENLDELPLPAYDLLPLDEYFYGSRLVETGKDERIFTIMSSRGCPNACIFCAAPVLYGNIYRGRSAKNIVDEMEVLINDYDVSHVVFYDASFMANRKRVEEICSEIISRGIKTTWRARVRADRLTPDLVDLMKKAGCTTLAIGVETGSQRLLEILGKNTTLEKIEDGFKIARDAGLWTIGYFFFGVPGETREESLQTIEFAKKLDPDWALFTHATPLPGTKLYEMTKDQMLSYNWSDFKFSANSPVISYDGMTKEEMQDLMDFAFQSFYLREEWLMNRLRKVSNPVQMERIVESFFDYFNKSVDRNAIPEFLQGCVYTN